MDLVNLIDNGWSLRSLTPPDLRVLAQWASDDEAAAAFFADARTVPALAGLHTGTPERIACLVRLDELAVAYVTFAPSRRWFAHEPVSDDERPYEISVLIGDPAYRREGLGRRVVALTVRYLLADRQATLVVAAPAVDNTGAIRCLEQVGFRRHRTVEEAGHLWIPAAAAPGDAERERLLMSLAAGDVRAAHGPVGSTVAPSVTQPAVGLIAPEPYDPRWPEQFAELAGALRAAFERHGCNERVARIDHIGSTAVPGLVAKPVIDVQVTLHELNDVPLLVPAFHAVGLALRPANRTDNPPPWETDSPAIQWRKAYFREAVPGAQRTHVHVRERGRRNQRYALLFRDYLRSNERPKAAYGMFKERLAASVSAASAPGTTGLYLDLKDPALAFIIDGAEQWAARVGWSPAASDF